MGDAARHFVGLVDPRDKGTEAIKLTKLPPSPFAKPAKLSSLKSAIKSWFNPELDDIAVDALVQSLQTNKKITVSGTKVTYLLG